MTEIDAILAPVEALLRPTYASASDETWQVNGWIEPISPDDLRAALDEARRVNPPVQDPCDCEGAGAHEWSLSGGCPPVTSPASSGQTS